MSQLSKEVQGVKAIALDPKLTCSERLNALRMLTKMGANAFTALSQIVRDAESLTVRTAAQKELAKLLFKKQET